MYRLDFILVFKPATPEQKFRCAISKSHDDFEWAVSVVTKVASASGSADLVQS